MQYCDTESGCVLVRSGAAWYVWFSTTTRWDAATVGFLPEIPQPALGCIKSPRLCRFLRPFSRRRSIYNKGE